MASSGDQQPPSDADREPMQRMGEGYFILGMAVQVGLVGLVGLALIGVQGIGFLSLGTAIALAGLAIGILAIGSILTLASLRHTLNVVHDHGDRLDQLAKRVGGLAQELRAGDEAVGWGAQAEAMDVAPPLDTPRAREDPRRRRPSPGPSDRPDPLDDAQTYSPIEVPGLDAEATERLEEVDIADTRQLWEADTMYVAGRLGAEPDEVRRWQALSQLMAIEGIDGGSAGHLSQAGVTSLGQLAHETPERLMRRLEETRPEGEGVSIDPQQAQAWIEAARAHAEARPAEGSEA